MKSADKSSVCLRDIVRIFGFSFSVRPIYASLGGDGPEIGFEMELTGSHPSSDRHVQGQCAQCQQVLLGLLELADHSLRQEEAQAQYVSTHCEKEVRYASSVDDWPEVVLHVTVIRKATLDDLAADRLTQLDRLLQLTEGVKTLLRNLGCRENRFDHFTGLPLGADGAISEPSFA